ncbi:MAG: RodZ domain-containing protein [Thermodesulfobacteriota bacterium]
MTDDQIYNETLQEVSLGVLLQNTRQARQKTLEDASDATRINAKFLQALEENDFEKLPDEIFTRGFIKLYATYLGLDPNDTVKHYLSQEKLAPCKPNVKIQRNEVIDSELLDRTSIFFKKTRRILPIALLLSILVLFYILGVFFKAEKQSKKKLQSGPDITLAPVEQSSPADSGQTTDPQKELPAKKIAETPSQPAEPPVPKPAVPAVESTSQAKEKVKTENIAATQPSAVAEKDPTPPAAMTQRTRQVKPVSLPITVAVATAPSPAPEQLNGAADVEFKYVLEAHFEESSLVRIKVDDKPQLQYNSQAGIIRRWKARESIVLDLDNRAGVSLTLNGQPFAITDTDGPTAIINIPADIPKSSIP